MKNPFRCAVALIFAALLSLGVARAGAATYYVSPSGNDASAGTSTATAWKTLAKANAVTLAPGDSLLFEGGQTFAGTIRPKGSGGTAASPVTIGSYGTGRATISAGANFGVYAYNFGGARLDNLSVVGTYSSTACNGMQDGVRFEANAAKTTFGPISITRCDVSGFYRAGVLVMLDLPTTAFASTTVTDDDLHGNGFAGLYTFAGDAGRIANLYVGRVAVHDNAGDAARTCSGNGMVIAGTTGATVERCVAYGNGATGKGGCGIWGYSSDHLTIQYNVSAHNRTIGADGDGFDLDDGTSNSTLQYNVSSDNDGGGYLFCQWHDLPAFSGNVIRYNVSSGDGRKNGYGGVQVWGRVHDCQVYNNSIFVVPSAGNVGVHLTNSTLPTLFATNITFADNLFASAGALTAVNFEQAIAAKSTGITFTGNLYRAGAGAGPSFAWAGKTYAGLAAFRAGALQETSGGNPVGSDADPLLAGPLPLQLPAALAVGIDVSGTAAPFVPAAGSPAGTAGILAATAGLTPPPVDIFGSVVLPASATHAGASVVAPAVAPTTLPTTLPTSAPAIVTVPVVPVADASLLGTTIGSTGSFKGSGNTIAKATDGDPSTFFDGPTADGMWVGLDLGVDRTVTRITFAPRVNYASRMTGGSFQASTSADFSSGVTTLYTIATAPAAGMTTVTIASPVAARYIRYLAPAGSSGNIAELQVIGH